MVDCSYRARLTWGGFVFLGLAVWVHVGAYQSDINLLYLIAATIYSLIVASLFVGYFSLRSLRVRRVLPYEARANEPFTVKLVVSNSSRRDALSIAAEDIIRVEGRTLRPRSYLLRVPQKGETVMRYCAQVPQRGVYACRGPKLISRFPFGLVAVTRVFEVTDELLVLPPKGRLLAGLDSVVHRPASAAALAARTKLGEEEFRTLREFVPGDNPRRIHWRTTARLGRPHVREMEREREGFLLLIVDTFIPNGDPDRLRRLELSLSFAAEVAERFVGAGGTVRFVAYGPELLVIDSIGNAERLHAMLEAMARIKPTSAHRLVRATEEEEVRFRGPGRKLVVALEREAAEELRRAAPDVSFELYVAGSERFNSVFEILPVPLRPGGPR